MNFEVNGKQVELHFGLDFMDEINRISGVVVDGGVNVGGAVAVVTEKLAMGDLTALGRAIYAASYGASPRPSLRDIFNELESGLDDEKADQLFDEVNEGIKNSFPLQYQLRKMEKMARETQRKAGATNATK